MAGRPRKDQSKVRKHFIAVRFNDDEHEALRRYIAFAEEQMAPRFGLSTMTIAPATIIRQAVREFLARQDVVSRRKKAPVSGHSDPTKKRKP